VTGSGAKIRFTRAATVWTAVALMITVVGWYKTINLLVLAGYFLLALLAVNLRLAWRASARLSVSRRPVPPAFAGELVALTAEIRNDASHPITTLVTTASAGNRTAWMFAPLAATDQRTITARWTFEKRGRHPLGSIVVDSSYPLGLVHVVRSLGSDAAVQVLPTLGQVNMEQFRRWLVRQNAGEGETRRPSRRPAVGTGEVRGLRPYRPGDTPREIHWKTSARRNQLWVREYDRTEPLDLILIVDPYLPDPYAVSDVVNPKEWETKRHENREAERRLEWALSLVVSLGFAAAESDAPPQLTLVLPGNELQVVSGRAGVAFVRQAFAGLADVVGTADQLRLPLDAVRPKAGNAARVILSPRSGGTIAALLRGQGISYAEASAERPPNWFTPPEFLMRKHDLAERKG